MTMITEPVRQDLRCEMIQVSVCEPCEICPEAVVLGSCPLRLGRICRRNARPTSGHLNQILRRRGKGPFGHRSDQSHLTA